MALSKERLSALKNEIALSVKFNDEEIEPIAKESIARYVGEHTPSIAYDWDIVLNEVYPIIQSNLPSIFFKNPRAFLKPRNKTFISRKRDPQSGKMVDIELDSTKSAKTQEHLLNYAISEIKYKREARKILLDALLFPFGIMWHGYKGDFGMTEESSLFIKNEMVFVKRISPLRFIHDPAVSVSNLEEARWVGRIIDMPYQDLIEDDKLDIDKKLIKGFVGYGDKVGGKKIAPDTSKPTEKKTLIDFSDPDFKNNPNAKFVRVYEIYLRPTKKEKRDGKKGTIILLTDEQSKPLRESNWTIKAEGFPSHILEFNEVPDRKYGIPDIDTYKDVADQKNAIVNLQLRNAQENSKVWVGVSKEGMNEEDVDVIRRGEQTIVLFESGNPRDRMFVASPGGAASSELYLIDGRIQKNLEDKSGVTDLKRGFLQSGEESAASVKIRAAGGSARPAYRQDIMADFLKDSLHYLNQLLKQFLPYKDAVRIVGTLDIQWSENPSKEEIQADTDVEIDVISMLPENPEKELQNLNVILSLMIQAIQDPKIMQKIQQEGKTINLTPIIEQILIRTKIRDPEIFRTMEPKEGMGYVSVQQLKEAQANVQAAVSGKQVPHPPKEDDDHRAKIETYGAMAQLLEQMGQISDTLNQLIQFHMALLSKMEEKETRPGKVIGLKAPSVKTV